MKGGLFKAGGGVGMGAGIAVGKGDGRLAEIGVEVGQLQSDVADRAVAGGDGEDVVLAMVTVS